jgi:hypothetical protein
MENPPVLITIDLIRRMLRGRLAMRNLRRMNCPQVASQPHVQSNGHAHYYQRTDAQYQEPPDHPHSRLG